MRLLRLLHAWSGAILALLLAVQGLSGALLVFKEDWLRLTLAEARRQAAVDPASLGAAAERLEAAHPGQVKTLAFGGPRLGVHRAYLAEEAGAYLAPDGTPIARWPRNGRPEIWLFDLHHHLLAGEVGETVSGVAGIAGLLLVLTGVVVWWPARRSWSLRLWPRHGGRAELLATHRNLGVLIAAPLVLLTLSGAAMVFSKPVLAAIAPGRPVAKPPKVGVGDVDWPRALAAAQARFPDATLRLASWPAKPGAPVSIRLKQPGEWHPNGRTTVLVDPTTGAVVRALDAQAEPSAVRGYNGLYPLHAAKVGGLLYKLVMGFSGLGLAALGLVGAWAFLRKTLR